MDELPDAKLPATVSDSLNVFDAWFRHVEHAAGLFSFAPAKSNPRWMPLWEAGLSPVDALFSVFDEADTRLLARNQGPDAALHAYYAAAGKDCARLFESILGRPHD